MYVAGAGGVLVGGCACIHVYIPGMSKKNLWLNYTGLRIVYVHFWLMVPSISILWTRSIHVEGDGERVQRYRRRLTAQQKEEKQQNNKITGDDLCISTWAIHIHWSINGIRRRTATASSQLLFCRHLIKPAWSTWCVCVYLVKWMIYQGCVLKGKSL